MNLSVLNEDANLFLSRSLYSFITGHFIPSPRSSRDVVQRHSLSVETTAKVMRLSCHRLIAAAWTENVCCRWPAMNFVQFFVNDLYPIETRVKNVGFNDG